MRRGRRPQILANVGLFAMSTKKHWATLKVSIQTRSVISRTKDLAVAADARITRA